MRAIVVREPGGPEVLELRRLPLPEPGRGEVRVRVAASGINRADLLQRRGAYPAPPGWPAHVPGLEFGGVVDALGEGVDGSESEGEAREGAAVPEVVTPFREGAVGRAGASNVERASTPAGVRVGDRVMGIVGGGGYEEAVVVHARDLVPIPRVLSIAEAGAVPEVFMTTFDALILQMKFVDDHRDRDPAAPRLPKQAIGHVEVESVGQEGELVSQGHVPHAALDVTDGRRKSAETGTIYRGSRFRAAFTPGNGGHCPPPMPVVGPESPTTAKGTSPIPARCGFCLPWVALTTLRETCS